MTTKKIGESILTEVATTKQGAQITVKKGYKLASPEDIKTQGQSILRDKINRVKGV